MRVTGKGRHSTVGEADSAYCARPDCPSSESVEYFIDRIIGRRPSMTQSDSTGLPKLLFLVRWQGCVVLLLPYVRWLSTAVAAIGGG